MNDDMQLDIFGNEIPVSNIKTEENRGRMPIKKLFRHNHGYKNGYYCKNCKHFGVSHYNCKNYYKCELIGISSSDATDIRLKDIACELYKERGEGNGE